MTRSVIALVIALAGTGTWLLSACKSERSSPKPPAVIIETRPDLPIGRKSTRPDEAVKTPKATPKRSSANPLVYVSGAGYEGWITPATSEAFWKPTADQITTMEAILTRTSTEGMKRAGMDERIDLTTYTRQYRGFIRDRRSFIEIRLFCAQSKHLARGPIQIKGGGNCYLRTVFDIGQQRFLDWHQNPQ